MKKIIIAFLFIAPFCACKKEKNAPAKTQDVQPVNGTNTFSNTPLQGLSGSSDTSSLAKKKKVVKIKYPKPKN